MADLSRRLPSQGVGSALPFSPCPLAAVTTCDCLSLTTVLPAEAEESDSSTPPSSPPITAARRRQFDDEEGDSDVSFPTRLPRPVRGALTDPILFVCRSLIPGMPLKTPR